VSSGSGDLCQLTARSPARDTVGDSARAPLSTCSIVGGFPDTGNKNNLLADFQSSVGSLQLPFQFVAPLTTSENFSVGNTSSGVTSIKIQNTTLTANLMLSNLAFNLSGQSAGALVPEPSSLALGSMALVGLAGTVYRRKRPA
jgi:hypothetical protein